jgi:hypothetical protein
MSPWRWSADGFDVYSFLSRSQYQFCRGILAMGGEEQDRRGYAGERGMVTKVVYDRDNSLRSDDVCRQYGEKDWIR